MLERIKSLFRFATKADPAPQSPAARADVVKVLQEELGVGHKPVHPGVAFWDGSSDLPNLWQMLTDAEAMLAHSRVSICLDYYKSGIAGAEFELEDASSPEVGAFGLTLLRRFWQHSREKAQATYDYGRGGYEVLYDVEDGRLVNTGLGRFFPLDCTVLTRKKQYVGVRVRNAGRQERAGHLDLWGPQKVPAKGFWFAHHTRYSRFYGIPQLYPAWRPWRRLAGRDGAEEIVDGGVYRFAYMGPLVRYPLEDNMPRPNGGGGGVSYGKDGQPVNNRDKAREFGENAKAGVTVAMSSRRDDKNNYIWDVEWPDHTLDPSALIAYTDNLEKAISLGIGVPPELLEASEVGSGYSGRAIPMEAFYVGQQSNAENLVTAWYEQIGEPLARWNYGPEAWFKLKVKPLLETKVRQQQAAQARPEGQQPGTAPAPERPTAFATAHAPPGGVTIGGKEYVGGEFIPGEVLEKATPEERAKVEGKPAEAPKKRPLEEWQARQDARDNARETLDAINEWGDLPERSIAATHAWNAADTALKEGKGDAEAAVQHARGYVGLMRSAWDAAEARAKAAGLTEREAGPFLRAKERAVAALTKKLDAYVSQAEKVEKLRTELAGLEAAEPDEPTYPDEPETEYPAEEPGEDAPDEEWDAYNAKVEEAEEAHAKAQEKYEAEVEKLDAAHEKAREKWEAACDRLDEKIDKEGDRLTDRFADLNDAIDEHDEKVSGELADAGYAAGERLDAEEEADPEPDEEEEGEDEAEG